MFVDRLSEKIKSPKLTILLVLWKSKKDKFAWIFMKQRENRIHVYILKMILFQI